jgi:hypothetical protein
MMLGVALWGLHMGFSKASLLTGRLIAPRQPKGTAFGIFNLVSGVCMLIASVLAGWLWHSFGSGSTFSRGNDCRNSSALAVTQETIIVPAGAEEWRSG